MSSINTSSPVDVMAILAAQQDQIDDLTAAVAAQQRALDELLNTNDETENGRS